MAWDAAYQLVICRTCQRRYRCTPQDDYYNATGPSDGVCERCLVGGLPVRTIESVYETCTSCGGEFLFPHLCRTHMLCGLCHPAPEEPRG